MFPAFEDMVTALSQRRQLIMGELEYYLQRHNVVDEGFDMVARYAKEGDSTLTAYMPHGNLVLTNALAILKRKREGKHILKTQRPHHHWQFPQRHIWSAASASILRVPTQDSSIVI